MHADDAVAAVAAAVLGEARSAAAALVDAHAGLVVFGRSDDDYGAVVDRLHRLAQSVPRGAVPDRPRVHVATDAIAAAKRDDMDAYMGVLSAKALSLAVHARHAGAAVAFVDELLRETTPFFDYLE